MLINVFLFCSVLSRLSHSIIPPLRFTIIIRKTGYLFKLFLFIHLIHMQNQIQDYMYMTMVLRFLHEWRNNEFHTKHFSRYKISTEPLNTSQTFHIITAP